MRRERDQSSSSKSWEAEEDAWRLFRYVRRWQRSHRRPFEHRTGRSEPRSVAGAVPDPIAIVPRHVTATVRADTAQRVNSTVVVAIDRDVSTWENDAVIPRHVIQIDRCVSHHSV